MSAFDSQLASLERTEVAKRTFLQRVYGWMAAGLALTGAVAVLCGQPETFRVLAPIFPVLLIVELLTVWGLSALAPRLSAAAVTATFVAYCALNGATLSVLLLVYTHESVAATFFVTGGSFAGLSLWAMRTKTDLSSWRSILFMGLIGLILASIVNLFLANTFLYWVITYAGVLIFCGLTAYDTQKLLALERTFADESEAAKKAAILGALTLYLDFVNLFIYLLRLLGTRRR